MIKEHLLNFKALERPWTEEFKRYFLGSFVDNPDIFSIGTLVQEASQEESRLTILILLSAAEKLSHVQIGTDTVGPALSIARRAPH